MTLQEQRSNLSPSTWDRRRIKHHLLGFFGGGTPTKDNGLFWTDGTIPWVSPKDMKSSRILSTEDKITLEAVRESATNLVPINSVLMVVRSGIVKHSLPVAINKIPVALNQDMKAFQFRSSLSGRFFAFWIEGQAKNLLLDWGQIGATVDNIDMYSMLNAMIPVPDVETQRVVDFLDRELDPIDQLIVKKERFQQNLATRIAALVDQAISDPNAPQVRFEHVTRRVHRPAILSQHDTFVRLGLYNRGRGIFKKPSADEEGMEDSDFSFVKEGDLILSGQFAWEGAVALAAAEEEGCVVSHRYTVFRGDSGVNTSYLLGLLHSSYGDFLLNEASRGSAGRNRPLNVRRLGKEKIPVPGSGLQKAVEHAVDFERRLKRKTEQSIVRLREFRAALITAAVTGQIDVATWGKQGQTDRRLERIEEAMRA